MSSTLASPNLHTLSVYVHNRPGVLVRVAHIFSRRGFNIESLVVSPSMDGKFSRMTITAAGDGATLEQIFKQVSKLVDVVHATEHSHQEVVEKELALVKIKSTDSQRTEILQVLGHFKAQTVDLTPASMVAQITGNTDKIEACISMLNRYGIIELVRTGKVIMARGELET